MAAATTIVSGGSRGLGLALVERLLARGDNVATFSRSGSARLKQLQADHATRLHAEIADAANSTQLQRFVAATVGRFGRIDHCVANAAVAHDGVLATLSDAAIDDMLAINLKGSIVLVRECVRQMLLQPGPSAPTAVGAEATQEAAQEATRGSLPGGSVSSIVVVSSVVAMRGSPGLAVYAATKAGLEGFARSLARELGPRGIRVNAIAPGFLETDLSAALSPTDRTRIVRRTPLGRLGAAADVTGAILFLTGPQAAFMTGQTLTIDGGGSS
jgi:3-oxoacyl-[acyl-carrier protein] reductase